MQNSSVPSSPEKQETPLKILPPIMDAKQWANTMNIKTPLKIKTKL